MIILKVMLKFRKVFEASTKVNIFKPYIKDHDFRFSNDRVDDDGVNLFIFDIRYQEIFTASQPINVEFKFDGAVPNDINGCALVLKNNVVSNSSDGQRHFNLL